MATKNNKTAANGKQVKAATAKESKKSATMEQIENLEKALENAKGEDVVNLVPEEIRADVETEKAEAIKANIQKESKRTFKDSDFTNWWNGSSNLF